MPFHKGFVKMAQLVGYKGENTESYMTHRDCDKETVIP